MFAAAVMSVSQGKSISLLRDLTERKKETILF